MRLMQLLSRAIKNQTCSSSKNKVHRKQVVFLAALVFLGICGGLIAPGISLVPVSSTGIIPAPAKVKFEKGSTLLGNKDISFRSLPSRSLGLSAQNIIQQYGRGSGKVEMSYNAKYKESAYLLHITRAKVLIQAGSESGFYYALESLVQMLRQNKGRLPLVRIQDEPRFVWRGMHLDVSRHFFSVEEIKRYLDLMAKYKMNVFHWHLTDDQGWRIEIEKYPKLTEIGAYRAQTVVGKAGSGLFDGKPYGGFYTQAQIKEVVAYAAERFIQVVPEIEMPGHAMAALAAYPQYACNPGPYEVATDWGVFEDVYCAGKDATFQFLTDILNEVMALFPGEYLHIGGDECPKTRWNNCVHCQARMQTEGLQDAHEIQSYFIRRIEKHVNAKGKKIIGWDEIMEGGLAPNALVMSWRGTEGGIAAAKAGHYAVMSPGSPCYFDHYQAQTTENEPLAICCYNPLEAVYAYEPIPAELSQQQHRYILGAQGNVWTEYMPHFDQVCYMALPRMLALAEVLWSPANKRNYADFLSRLPEQAKFLDEKGYKYGRHGW
jgi:hexosaminidase